MKTPSKLIALASAGLAGLLALAIPAASDEDPKKDGPNSSKAGPEKPKTDAKAQGVHDLGMAYDLVAYGRKSMSPEALILAAKILAATPITPGDDSFKMEAGEKIEPVELSPARLLAEAREMNGDDHIAALAASAGKQISERSRGEIDGPRDHNGGVGPNGVAVWNGVFRGGELASVTIAGYGDADLDLYIFDDRGGLVAQDRSPDYNPTCTWSPIYTGKFTMRVVNCTPTPAGFRLIHN